MTGRRRQTTPRCLGDALACSGETGKCPIFCKGVHAVISLEPLAYAVQQAGAKPPNHCDYILVHAKDDAITLLLVEIDPEARHDYSEIREKMETCRAMAEGSSGSCCKAHRLHILHRYSSIAILR